MFLIYPIAQVEKYRDEQLILSKEGIYVINGTSAIKNDKVYTYEDYLSMEENIRCEIIDGVLYSMAAPSRLHQKLSKQLSFRIDTFLQGKKCELYYAPSSVVLLKSVDWKKLWEEFDSDAEFIDEVTDPLKSKQVVEPDIFVVCDKNKLTKNGCVGAPDFIIEILSPSERKKDLKTKRDLYELNGVREYWTVDIDKRRIIQYVLAEDDMLYHYVKIFEFNDRVPCVVLEGCAIDFSTVDLS